MRKRLFAGLLTLVMIVSLVPMSALAVEDEPEVVPCTVAEGCTLADGHDGDCVLPAEPEDGDSNGYYEFEDVTDGEDGIMPLGEDDGEVTPAPMSGSCGATSEDDVTWALTQNSDGTTYTLAISGSGAMADYTNPTGGISIAPWYSALTPDTNNNMVPITQVVIGDQVTGLGNYAFAYTSVEKAEFKANVKDYGDALYYSCQNLTTVNWDNFYPENISDGWVTDRGQTGTYIPFSLFDGCGKLNTCIIGGKTYEVGTLVLPEYISVVCTAAFRGTGFDKIDFSDGLKNITAAGPYAFAQTAITAITIPSNIEFYHQNSNAAANTFNKCGSLESVTIQDTGTTIVSGMFSNCTALKTITGGDNIDTIETTAFQYCSSLESFSSDSVQKIDSQAFWESGLKSLSLGKIKTIGANAFLGCGELATVSIVGTSDLVIPSTAFSSWQSTTNPQYSSAAPLVSFTLENGTVPAFTAAAKENLTSLKLGDGITSVPDSLCNGFSKLESVELGAGITKIGANAFKGTKITSIAIPDSVTEIGNYAFADCTELKNVTISADSQLTTIGNYAFRSTGISSIYIPQNVTKLGDGAFNNCYSLAAVDMTAISSISGITFGQWVFSRNAPSEGAEDLRRLCVFYVSDSSTQSSVIPGFSAWYDTLAVTNGGTFIKCPTFTDEKFDTPAKSGQVFAGWYQNSSFSGDTVDGPAKQSWGGYGQTYYAKWENSSYSINQNYIAFSSMTYGTISGSNTITVSGSGGSGSTSAASSDENIFTVSVNGNTITVTPVSTLAAGDYSETITVTTPDGATFSVPVTLTVKTANSTVTPGDENNGNITATYGDTITLTAKTQRAAESGIALMAALDEVDFVYGNIVLGRALVNYSEDGVGTATLTYDTSKGGIPVNQEVWITAEYGGSVNLNGSYTNSISVTLSPKALTVIGLIAADRAYDGTTIVALSGGTLSGIVGSDDVSADMPTTGTIDSAGAGDNKAVTISTITLTGSDASKYTVTALTGLTVNITAATLTAPVLSGYTATTTSITVTAPEVPAGASKVQYSIDNGSTWQDSNVFSGLTSGTSYTVIAKFVANDSGNYADSANSTALSAKTNSTGGGGGGSSSGGSTSYTVSVDSTKNGTVSVSPKNASKGTTVTVTVKPNSGYELDRLTVTDKDGKTVKITEGKNGQYTFTMPAGKVNVEAAFAKIEEQPSVTFTDVPTSAYYYDAVEWAVENGITNGTSATTFSPDATCTRAQTVTFLWRAAGSPAPKSSVNPFTDVQPGAYYYDAVLWAVENGITNGTSATTFGPDDTVTRGQTVTFQHRAAGSPAVGGGSFADVAADAYYAPAVQWAVANGITNGTSSTTFSPDAPCTRGQIVTFLYRDMAE